MTLTMTAKLFNDRAAPVKDRFLEKGPLSLVDRSRAPYAGLKGPRAAEWIAQHTLLPGNNQALLTECGQLLLQLAPEEFLLCCPDEDRTAEASSPLAFPAFELSGDVEPGLVPVPRSDMNAWMSLEETGGQDAAAQRLATLCAIDFREPHFPSLRLAQTSLARTNAIILKQDIETSAGLVRRFHIFADWSTSSYLWRAIAEAL